MKIGISLLTASKNKVGPDNVSFNLIRNLIKIDKQNEYVIFINNEALNWFSLSSDRFRVVHVKLTARRFSWFWEHLFFHFDPRRKGIDLLHFPQSQGVFSYRGKFIMTIHDLRNFLHPHLVKYSHHLRSKALLKRNISKASMIIAVSQYVKDEILQHFPVPPDKIQVVHNGIDKRFKPSPKSIDFIAKYGLPAEYILFVGETHPNKNLRRTIEAFRDVRKKNHLNHHFVIAGFPGTDDDNLKAYVHSFGLDDLVHFLGYFPDEDLPFLYHSASLFVYTSLDEGFGIPPLEAMSCGIPVVASNVTSIPEILENSAILVNPLSVNSIASGIENALVDNHVREEKIRKGKVRSKLFSWDRMARKIIEIYREVLSNKIC